jgi:hypothetical protein
MGEGVDDGVLHMAIDVEDLELGVILTATAEFFLFEHIEVCSGIPVKNQDATPLPELVSSLQ